MQNSPARSKPLLPRHCGRVPALRRNDKAADGAARVRKAVGALVLRLHLRAASAVVRPGETWLCRMRRFPHTDDSVDRAPDPSVCPPTQMTE